MEIFYLHVYVVGVLLELHASFICYAKNCGELVSRGGYDRNWYVEKYYM